MSTKIKNPNEKSNGFLWALIALLVIVAVVVGYIVINGRDAKNSEFADKYNETTSFTTTVDGSVVSLKSDSAGADAKKVDIYEDFSCVHCAELAEATDADMKKLIEDGKIVVNIHSLNFQDRGNAEGNSTKAGTAAWEIAKSGNSNAYWNYRTLLLAEQQNIYGQWDNAKFANVASQVGADESVVSTIESGSELATYNTDVAQANFDHLDEIAGPVSSPRVFIDDKEVDNASQWPSQI